MGISCCRASVSSHDDSASHDEDILAGIALTENGRAVAADLLCATVRRSQRSKSMPKFRSVLAPLLAVTVSAIGCGKDSSTSTTTTSASPTPADATITESFSTSVDVGGGAFYSFGFVQYGNYTVTLKSVSGVDLPSDLTIGLGLGRPSGTGCTATSTITTAPGDAAQLTGTNGPGVYCVRVYDAGTLPGKIAVTVTVTHS